MAGFSRYPAPSIAGPTGPSGVIKNTGMKSGLYYSGNVSFFDSDFSLWGAGSYQTYYVPIFIPENRSFDRIAIHTMPNTSETGLVRLGIYNNFETRPSSLILDAGTVSCSAPSTRFQITINITLESGWYWLAFNIQSVQSGPNFVGRVYYPPMPGISNFVNGTIMPINYAVLYQASVNGAFSDAGNFSGGTVHVGPLVMLRAV